MDNEIQHSVVPVALFVLMGFIAWIIFGSIRGYLVAKMDASARARLLDKFDSAQSLLIYAENETGRRFLNSLMKPATNDRSPYKGILFAVQAAILLFLFGATILILHWSHVLPSEDFIVMGTLPIALGIGFALSALATYRLSERFGLLKEESKG